jgi:hypothetical protein
MGMFRWSPNVSFGSLWSFGHHLVGSQNFGCLRNVPTSHSVHKSCQFFGQQESNVSLANILARQWLAQIGGALDGVNHTFKHLNNWHRSQCTTCMSKKVEALSHTSTNCFPDNNLNLHERLSTHAYSMKHSGSVVSSWKDNIWSYVASYKKKLIQQINILPI